MSPETKAVLESQEEVVWEGKINRSVMIFQSIMSMLIIGGVSAYLFSQPTISLTSDDGAVSALSGSLLGAGVLAVGLLLVVIGFFSSYVVEYVITNKRLLIKSGLIGTDFNSVYFTEVKTANVNVNLIDKIFSVGTVNIDTGKMEAETVTTGSGQNTHTTTQVKTAYTKLSHIDNPYEVYKYFQKSLTERQESLYSGRADKENIK